MVGFIKNKFLCPALIMVFIAGMVLISHSAASAIKYITVGKAPPPFALPDLSGEVVTSEYLGGSPGAIIFWSTWSPRSADILEDFKKYHQEYADKGLRIVAINIDGENLSSERKKDIREYAQKREMLFPVLLDENLEVFSSYGVMAHPSVILTDKDGTVSYSIGGYPLSLREEVKTNIEKLLGIYVEPVKTDVPPSIGYVPEGHALQYYNLGKKMMERGQTDKALDSFQKAADKDPEFIEPVIYITRIKLIEGETAEAEEIIKNISSGSINRTDIRFILGYLMLLKDRLDGAEALFNSLKEKSPAEGWGYWGAGLVILAKGDPASAAGLLEEARKIQPDNPEAEAYLQRYLKGFWMQRQNPPEEERLLAIFPSLPSLKKRYQMMFGGS